MIRLLLSKLHDIMRLLFPSARLRTSYKSALHSEFEITHLLVTATRFNHPFKLVTVRDPWIGHFKHMSTRTHQHPKTCLHLDPIKNIRDDWERIESWMPVPRVSDVFVRIVGIAGS
jgi:hypothetical protein